MPQFLPDLVEFGDAAGMGQWEVSHYREHLQFVQILGSLSTPVEIPDYPMLSFLTQPDQNLIGLHSTAHALLRGATGVTGVDLAELDLQEGQGFEDWLNFHRQEHAQIRAVLGLT